MEKNHRSPQVNSQSRRQHSPAQQQIFMAPFHHLLWNPIQYFNDPVNKLPPKAPLNSSCCNSSHILLFCAFSMSSVVTQCAKTHHRYFSFPSRQKGAYWPHWPNSLSTSHLPCIDLGLSPAHSQAGHLACPCFLLLAPTPSATFN